MLINPYSAVLRTYPGTRVLEDMFGLDGLTYIPKKQPERTWNLKHLLAPIPNRHLGGVRAKFEDDKGFITVCNQRDLEVIIGIGTPGTACLWSDEDYAPEGGYCWYGLCMDEFDLDDDLFEREILERQHFEHALPVGLELRRLLHDGGRDYYELLTLRSDTDNEGMSPDPRLETVSNRWSRIEKVPLRWDEM